jgi:4'-phosphopantetheinyl transferase
MITLPAPGEIHLWSAALDNAPPHFDAILSDDERARAAKFYFEQDRVHFIAARGWLRTLLGRYLDLAPAELVFSYQARGKPFLPDTDLQFNLSHSHGLAWWAITRRQPIGIDIEKIRPEVAGREIAENFFAPQEIALLQTLSPELYSAAFFHCWTRKEAYIKAQGDGLALALNSFAVSVHPAEPARFLVGPPHWTLIALHPADGYVGAVVIEGDVHNMIYQGELG